MDLSLQQQSKHKSDKYPRYKLSLMLSHGNLLLTWDKTENRGHSYTWLGVL